MGSYLFRVRARGILFRVCMRSDFLGVRVRGYLFGMRARSDLFGVCVRNYLVGMGVMTCGSMRIRDRTCRDRR